MAGSEPKYSEGGHWLGDNLAKLIPKSTGPIREPFVDHSEAVWEYTVTNLVYGSMATYCVYYLLR